jgi:DNA invertase Pin-like site-specific DNA recombinase
MLDVVSCLATAKEKGIIIYDVKNGFELDGRFQGELMAMVFSMVAQIERDLISLRTKEGLRAARAQGKMLGRPKGPGKSKLDPYKDGIVKLLENGSTKTYVAMRYGCTVANLFNWLKKNKLNDGLLIKEPIVVHKSKQKLQLEQLQKLNNDIATMNDGSNRKILRD